MSFATADRLYKKPITVGTAVSSVTNFQKKITVSYVSGKMATDFSDLIFQTDGGTNISYWIESKTDSSSASVWIKLPNTSNAFTQTIYMYYVTEVA